jgi:hypothetical protein
VWGLLGGGGGGGDYALKEIDIRIAVDVFTAVLETEASYKLYKF